MSFYVDFYSVLRHSFEEIGRIDRPWLLGVLDTVELIEHSGKVSGSVLAGHSVVQYFLASLLCTCSSLPKERYDTFYHRNQ